MRFGVCVMFAVAGCGGSGAASHSTVGPAGGQVSASDGTSVTIPSGALPSSTNITVTSTSAPAPANTQLVGTPYLFGPEGTQFAQPVTIELAFSEALLPAGTTAGQVVIYTAPAGSTEYAPLATALIDGSHVESSTTHFSIFVAAVSIVQTVVDAGTTDGPDASMSEGSDGGGGGPDLRSLSDLAEAVDAGVCTPVIMGSTSVCTVSAGCGGHTYEVRCGNGACTCYTDGVAGKSSGNLGLTCPQMSAAPAWAYCGFP